MCPGRKQGIIEYSSNESIEMGRILFSRIIVALLALSAYKQSWSSVFVLPANGNVIGEIQYANVQAGETLSDVGIRYDVGYYEMVAANPLVDPIRRLPPATKLIIPSEYVLPSGPRQGLVINLAEYRLYYFPPNDNTVVTLPVGIGREGWNTPIGLTKITAKERDPIWRPTANVRAEAAKNGTPIPNEFPPGEGNPLGRHVMRLGWPTYLIHGTNRRDGVGARVSAGCIRMMPEDIEVLYEQVPVGTTVRVVDEPIKIGHLGKQLILEVHPPLIEHRQTDLHRLLANLLPDNQVNQTRIEEELAHPSGIPKRITS